MDWVGALVIPFINKKKKKLSREVSSDTGFFNDGATIIIYINYNKDLCLVKGILF